MGWAGALGDNSTLDVKLTRYNYLNEPTGVDYAYNELITTVGLGETYSFTLAYTNDYLNADLDSVYAGVAGSWALNQTYTLNANAGWTSIAGPRENYFDYGISLSRSFGPATVSLGYVASSSGAESNFGRDAAEDKVLLTIGFGG